MSSGNRDMVRRVPKIAGPREFLEITRDFIDPRNAIREAISNSLDWGATEVHVTITEDKTRPDEELVIEVTDNGLGLTEDRLDAFFDLGRTTFPDPAESLKLPTEKIGCKGHGTKTYFNSRQIQVYSRTSTSTIYAIMDEPLQSLMNDQLPPYDYRIDSSENEETGLRVVIRGYNMNRNKNDFGHNVLKDYVIWFTRFGSIEKELKVLANEGKVLYLRGLGQASPEAVAFGHPFPKVNCEIAKMMKSDPGGWTKKFVKNWIRENRQIVENPGKSIDFVFYIEGDEAKRSYNPMIRGPGRTPEYGMYKVEDRYGLWVCKDYIPIKRYNEWLGLGKRLETKYHAFVNCQEFRLTANRGDVGNTSPDLLSAIERTVRQIFEDEIIGSNEYQEYEDAEELEKQYQTAQQEEKDFSRRRKRVRTKKVCSYQGIELVEPGVEMGVISLFNLIYALSPSIFPFRVIDYDSKKGYDALVAQRTPLDLSSDTIRFAEFKFTLKPEFNHSFEHLAAIICWDCKLSDGDEVSDIRENKRELHITQPGKEGNYTRYMLVTSIGVHNIEVFVLKSYLKEKLGLEFHSRSKSAPT